MAELDIHANTPSELLAKANDIVVRHRELQAKTVKYQKEVSQSSIKILSRLMVLIYLDIRSYKCCYKRELSTQSHFTSQPLCRVHNTFFPFLILYVLSLFYRLCH
jgi:hypothetical protein